MSADFEGITEQDLANLALDIYRIESICNRIRNSISFYGEHVFEFLHDKLSSGNHDERTENVRSIFRTIDNRFKEIAKIIDDNARFFELFRKTNHINSIAFENMKDYITETTTFSSQYAFVEEKLDKALMFCNGFKRIITTKLYCDEI